MKKASNYLSSEINSKITAHPLPTGDTICQDVVVKADGIDIPVVNMLHNRCYAHFSYSTSETIDIEVITNSDINSFSISPNIYQINAINSGKKLSFSITGQKYLMLEINSLFSLWIIADPLEINPPKPDDTDVINIMSYNVDNTGEITCTNEINRAIIDAFESSTRKIVYFPAGLYKSETINLKAGVILYLAAGSVIKASDEGVKFIRSNGLYNRRTFINGYKANGAKIKGRGVIDGNGSYLRNIYTGWDSIRIKAYESDIDCECINGIQLSQCNDIEIEGIINRYSNRWSTYIHYCNNVDVKNYKVFGHLYNKNDDGLDLDSCVNVSVKDSLFNTFDDGVCLKTCATYNGNNIAPDGLSRDMHSVLIENNTFYIKDCPAMKYGFSESEASNIYNITLQNNKIINAREGVTIRPKGSAVCYDWKVCDNYYENITGQNYRLDPESMKSHDITFSNEKHLVFGAHNSTIFPENVVFHNLEISGQLCMSLSDAHITSDNRNVKFRV